MGKQTEWITFGLGFCAYALLALDVLHHARGSRSRRWSLLTAGFAVAHVICIWVFRLEFDWRSALSRSPAAMVAFHFALGLIVAAPFLSAVWWSRALALALALTTIGSIGAVILYAEVRILAIPVVAVAVLKGGRAALLWWQGRSNG